MHINWDKGLVKRGGGGNEGRGRVSRRRKGRMELKRK